MNKIFITGGTGFLGSEMIKEIIFTSTDHIYALVRGKTQELSEKRLLSILSKVSDGVINEEIFRQRIKVFKGDIASDKLGLEESQINEIIKNVDIIYNNAAFTDLNMAIEDIRKINVYGTRNVLDLAMRCKDNGRLQKVNHISTAYIVGKKKCVFKETDLDIDQDFNNTYEQSKFEAELLVNEYRKKDLRCDVFRPSMILGRSSNGFTSNFKMLYQPIHFIALGLFDKIPADKDGLLNLINIDTAAKLIVFISNVKKTDNTNYNIVSPEPVSFIFAVEMASLFFGFDLPEFIDSAKFDIENEYTAVMKKMIGPYLPYFKYQARFDMQNTNFVLERRNFRFPEFDKKNFFNLYEFYKNKKKKKEYKNVITK